MNDRSQERLEEGEEMLKFLQMIPESSSQETIFTEGDQEQKADSENIFFGLNICCRKEERGALTESEEVSCTSRDIVENYGGNIAKCQWKMRNEFGEENDSGFATSSEQPLKVFMPYNLEQAKLMHEEIECDLSDSEDSCQSMESVSLLQNSAFMDQEGYTESGEACMDTTWNMKPFPSLPYYEDNMQVDEDWMHPFDKSVQTVRSISRSEERTEQITHFLSSVINLRYIVLPNKDLSAKKYLDLLKSANQAKDVSVTSSEESVKDTGKMENEKSSMSRQFHGLEDVDSSEKLSRYQVVVSHEARTTNLDDIMLGSVESILVWLKNEMRRNCKYFCNYWHGSIRADSVDRIIEVVDLHAGLVRTKVSQFLFKIFDEIYESNSPVEDTVLECETAFLSCFSKSVLLSKDLIEHISGKLPQCMKLTRSRDKFQKVTLITKNYFSLRLLSDLLRSFLDHIQTEGFQSVFSRRSSEEELNVLNLWTRDLKKRDGSRETDVLEMGVKCINAMALWCRRTEQILHVCLIEIPILLQSAYNCHLAAQDILFFQDGMLKKNST